MLHRRTCVQYFDLSKLPKSKCEYPVSGSVQFQPEQITCSADIDSVPEQ